MTLVLPGDFQTGDFTQWDTEGGHGHGLIAPGQGEVLTGRENWPEGRRPPRPYFARFHADTVDPNGDPRKSRCEVGMNSVRTRPYFGAEGIGNMLRWWTFLPSDFTPAPGKIRIIMDCHATQVPVVMSVEDGQTLQLTVTGGRCEHLADGGPKPPTPTGFDAVISQPGPVWYAVESRRIFPLATLDDLRGRWVRWLARIHWSATPTKGSVLVWAGNRRVLERTILPTLVRDPSGDVHPVAQKLGIYRVMENTMPGSTVYHTGYSAFAI